MSKELGPGGAERLLVAGAAGIDHDEFDVGATHVLRLGPPDVRRGFVPMPGIGPDLTWRAVNDTGQPPLSNWDLRLGDIELF